ncbi:MAG: formylglycine-generating enzyme family protein [Alloprevotella sp.]
MNRLKTFLLAFAAAMVAMPSMAQGVVVFKKDGTRVVYPYEAIDSIVTYNYDETPPNGGPVSDGQNKVYTVNGVSFKMIAVKGGTFTMGATSEQTGAFSNESPTHSVTLSDYYIGETEVTQELWTAVMGSNPSNFTGNMQRPVEKVSWNDCQTFISKLNELTGETFRLPTEAQWEYAARGGNQAQGRLYSGSNTIDDVAWYTSNSSSTTHPVKTKAPNELGIYDMSGNVWEWCSDWYGSSSSAAQTDPTGPSTGSHRVLRGGSWSDNATHCRVAYRVSYTPASSISNLGLRLAH